MSLSYSHTHTPTCGISCLRTAAPLLWPWSIDCAGCPAQRSLSQSPRWADLLLFGVGSLLSDGMWFRSWYTAGTTQVFWLTAVSRVAFFFSPPHRRRLFSSSLLECFSFLNVTASATNVEKNQHRYSIFHPFIFHSRKKKKKKPSIY